MNVFGEGEDQGLTNPLTEDILADNFNALDFNEVHLNELHDNSGTGKIVVHEEFNMTNNQISNLADPIQDKDATNKEYVDDYVLTVTGATPYDLFYAFTDETTSYTNATYLPVVNMSPNKSVYINTNNVNSFIGYLSVPTQTSQQSFGIYIEGTPSNTLIGILDFPLGASVSQNTTTPTQGEIPPNSRLVVRSVGLDNTWRGLKLFVNGKLTSF